jgi:hypothetical protein
MTKRKQAAQRPFNSGALDAYAVPALRIRMGPGETVWRYTITIPLEEIRPHKRQKATAQNLEHLQEMFADDFGGFSKLPNSSGYGPRDPTDLNRAPEMNYNTGFAVLASPIPEADAYFRALREELQAALDEGVILVERQEAWIP